jgi:hypothetical protein
MGIASRDVTAPVNSMGAAATPAIPAELLTAPRGKQGGGCRPPPVICHCLDMAPRLRLEEINDDLRAVVPAVPGAVLSPG